MKVISLWEPWASLIAWEEKRIETRVWSTSYRGPIAIAATQRTPQEAKDWALTALAKYIRKREIRSGCIVAVAELVECFSTDDMPRLDARELDLGNYGPGRWGWVLEDIRALRTPIPFLGTQGLRDLSPEMEQKVRRQNA